MNERLGIAGSGAIARGLARPPPSIRAWSSGRAASSRPSACASGRDHVDVVTDIEELADCTLVVEAVVEDRDVKSHCSASSASCWPRTP